MASKESSSAGKPWTSAERRGLRRLLEKRVSRQPKVPQATDPGIEYSQLVSEAGLADGVWYRGYSGGKSHEFVLPLTNPNRENMRKAYMAEVDLQGKFPLVSFDFNLGFSALSDEKKADLEDKGYKWIPGQTHPSDQKGV